MRWSIIRLIWVRELRDQLRDRRTILMIVGLPLLLYPLVGFGLMQFALGFVKKTSVIGVVGAENLPQPGPTSAGLSPLPATVWLTLPTGAGPVPVAGVSAHALLLQGGLGQDDAPLFLLSGGSGRFVPSCFDNPGDVDQIVVKALGTDPALAERASDDWLAEVDRSTLDGKQVEALVVVPPDFRKRLAQGGKPVLAVVTRDGDEHSRLVGQRVQAAIAHWKQRLKEARFLRTGLPADFDDPVEVRDPARARSAAKAAAEGLFDMIVRVFPFMIVMWSLAGALYPAVDLCAGEKERGTMETLLISPAAREEIVYGKFLAIWVFSGATALLNLVSLGMTTWHFRELLPADALRPMGLLWSVLLVLPLSAFFSALCLAVGAYARSSKEGQYYLMPLFLLTMPLVFLSLAPGVELNPFYSMVPVTGIALLMQKLMTTGTVDRATTFYFTPVLAPMALYGYFALRWAVEQFQREEVLFREAERFDVGLWLRRLLREKEPLPSVGQALFCFALVLLLRWLSLGLGGDLSLLTRSAVGFVAFLGAPPLFMAILLTTRPAHGLGFTRPSLRALAGAALLALLLLPPLAELTQRVLDQFPGIKELMNEHHALTEQFRALTDAGPPRAPALGMLLTLAVLPAVFEELAFRGFILTGLRGRYGPWKALTLSSFLFAFYHMNVFQFLPAFVLGGVLGMLALRTGSVLPGMLFHLLHNGLLLGLVMLQGVLERRGMGSVSLDTVRSLLAAVCAGPALFLLWRWGRGLTERPPGAEPAGLESEPITVAASPVAAGVLPSR